MKKTLLLACLLTSISAAYAAIFKPPTLYYNGEVVEFTDEFVRKQCGSIQFSNVLPEVSGIACSRVTPGYIWMESDDKSFVIATTEKGKEVFLKVNLNNKKRSWDWEDLCGGVYNGKDYLFVGAFGDNDEDDGDYFIIFFEEPAIDPDASVKSITQKASNIKFEYPDHKKHNCEALMYDNVDQMLYIITKVYYNVCQVFSLPMSLEYGDETQTLTYICDLGVKEDLDKGETPNAEPKAGVGHDKGFQLVTGADISPDGSRILIKNHNNTCTDFTATLIWERQEGESVGEAIMRQQPLEISSYRLEWQGEAICWLDNYIFYTTSDDEGAAPIFKYTSQFATPVESVLEVRSADKPRLMLQNGHIYLLNRNGRFTVDGRAVR